MFSNKNPFEKAFEPAAKHYSTRLICYASGVVQLGKGKDVFHLTLEYELNPAYKGYWLRYYRGFDSTLSILGSGNSKKLTDEKSAWQQFRKEVKHYKLKIIYKTKK